MAIFGPIHSERKYRRFGVLDLEWVPGEELPLPQSTLLEIEGIREAYTLSLPVKKRRTTPLQLRVGGYYDQQPASVDGDTEEMIERYHSFTSMSDMVEFLLSRDHRAMWFYAHAGGLYDMEFVLDELLNQIKQELVSDGTKTKIVYGPNGEKLSQEVKSQSWVIRASFSGSSAIIIHVSRGKNSWHFVDSYWLLRDKLSKIGESIGILKMDEDKRQTKQEIIDYYTNTPLDELTKYNKVDCEILWKAIAAFEKEIIELGGQLQQTIASTAMGLFRRAYLKQDIYTSESINVIAAKSYFASRVEVYSRFADDFFVYDINSSFPYSMTFPMPGNLKGVGVRLPENDSDECIYVADVTVEVPDTTYLPPLPFRTKDDSRVFFPTGRWRSWFTSTDIRLAMREGCTIHAVHEVYEFEPFYDFKQYADELYSLRATADNGFRKLLLKYLLNSLYGKAAESVDKQEMLINPDMDSIDRATLQLLQPGIWLREKKATINHRHVMVSSIITSLSRRLLFDYCKMCFEQKQQVYYCDTDSIATKALLPVDPKKLGMLKLEKKMEWADFVAPKIYRGEGDEVGKNNQWKHKLISKAKGFSLGHDEAEAFVRLGEVIEGKQVGVQTMVRMRELYRTQDRLGMHETAPYEKLTIKALTGEMLSKRFHYPDGESRPWSVKEIVSGDTLKHKFDLGSEGLDAETKSAIEAAV